MADTKSTEIYPNAYKSMNAKNTSLVLSKDRKRFKFIKGVRPDGDIVPARCLGDN